MLTNKARKMLKKIDAYAKEELANFGSITKKNAGKYIVLQVLNELEETVLDWNSIEKNKYILKSDLFDVHKMEWSVLFLGSIVNWLPEVEACNREMVDFVSYMLEELVKIYSKQENGKKVTYAISMYYKDLRKHIIKGGEYDTFVLESKKHTVKDAKCGKFVLKNKKSINVSAKLAASLSKIDPDAERLFEICSNLEDAKIKCDIDYIDQYATIDKLGIKKWLILELSDVKTQAMIEDLNKNDSTKEILEAEKLTVIKSKNESSELSKTKEKEVILERRVLLEQLRKYVNLETLEADDILTEKEINEVLNIASRLYDEQTVKKIKHTLLSNNQKYQNFKKDIIRDLLIPDNRKSFYDNLCNYCFLYQGQDVQYKNIFLKYFNDINALVEEYMKEENELLIPDYKGQIELLFLELDMYLPYMPIDVFTGQSRT